MVFENLTLVELHLENARFGPSFGSTKSEDAEDHSPTNGRSARWAAVAVGGGVALMIGALAARRFLGEDEGDDEGGARIEIDAPVEQ